VNQFTGQLEICAWAARPTGGGPGGGSAAGVQYQDLDARRGTSAPAARRSPPARSMDLCGVYHPDRIGRVWGRAVRRKTTSAQCHLL